MLLLNGTNTQTRHHSSASLCTHNADSESRHVQENFHISGEWLIRSFWSLRSTHNADSESHRVQENFHISAAWLIRLFWSLRSTTLKILAGMDDAKCAYGQAHWLGSKEVGYKASVLCQQTKRR